MCYMDNFKFGKICCLIVIILIIIPILSNNVFAEDKIRVSAINFENSSILEFYNNSENHVKTIRMWANEGFSIESSKVEGGWNIEKTSQGVIVFTSERGLKESDSTKIGIKTNNISTGINWKVIDVNGNVIDTSIIIPGVAKNETETITKETKKNRFDTSTIKFIPEKIRVDSNFRVVGEGFIKNENVEIFIGTQKLKSLKVNEDGKFIDSIKIPSLTKIERNEITVRNNAGDEKLVSLRIYESFNRLRENITVPFSIEKVPTEIVVGDMIRISGTSMPENDVIITILDEEENIETTGVIKVNSKGAWFFERIISEDTKTGKRVITIEDGKTKEVKTINVITNKKIQIHPVQIKYEAGDTIVFEGNAIPNQELEIIIEDPKRTKIFSNVIDVDASGRVLFSYETKKSDTEGTYILTASQGNESEIIFVGLGMLPKEQLIVKTDSLNYSTTDQPVITVKGSNEIDSVNLLIIDPSDKEKLSDVIEINSSGYADYELDIKGFSTGVYTVVVSKSGSQDSTIFTVGLQTGSGPINASVTKESFKLSDTILIIGETGKNTILTISLIDPDNKVHREIKTFSDKDGKFSDESFRIPIDAKIGVWKLNIKSGGNYTELDIDVTAIIQDSLIIQIDNEEYKHGEIITLSGSGAKGNRVFVTIFDPNDMIIIELDTPRKNDGTFTIPWSISGEYEVGQYRVSVEDNGSNVETVFYIIH